MSLQAGWGYCLDIGLSAHVHTLIHLKCTGPFVQVHQHNDILQ